MTSIARTKDARLPRTRYQDDLYTWVAEQVALLREGRLDDVDVHNVAGELSKVGNEQLFKLASAIAVLIQHLLKWDFQSERRSRSWELSIAEHRRRVSRLLELNPGLKSRLQEAIGTGYSDGRRRALDDSGLPTATLPVACPYTFDEMMTRPIAFESKPALKSKKR